MNKPAAQLKVKRLHEEAVIPKYESKGASGFDLTSIESVVIEPGQTKLVSTGLSFEIPQGYEIQIRPRSGLSYKTKLRVANSPGTIDSDYRGEIKILLENTDYSQINNDDVEVVEIEKGDRVAQAVLAPVTKALIIEAENLSDTERGEGGFGSTGKN